MGRRKKGTIRFLTVQKKPKQTIIDSPYSQYQELYNDPETINPILIPEAPKLPDMELPFKVDGKYPIYVGPTRILIPCRQSGHLWDSRHLVYPVINTLKEYKKDWSTGKNVVTAQHAVYDPRGIAILPRFALSNIKGVLNRHFGLEEDDLILRDLPSYDVTPSSFEMRFEPRENQVELIDRLTDGNYPFVLLEAATGIGKTFCSITALSKLGQLGLVITSGLVDQWVKEAQDKSDLTRDDIYVIQGKDSIDRLQNDFDWRPKLIVASTRTLAIYAQAHGAKKIKDPSNPYRHFMPLGELMKKLGVGVKVIDEVHENFAANTSIDLACDIPRNIYLSATYIRSDSISNRIFNQVYPEELRYGSHLRKKYLIITTCGYYPGDIDEERCSTRDGYNHYLYEKILIKHSKFSKAFLESVVDTTIDEYFLKFRKEGQKCMFIAGKTEMADLITEYINNQYPSLNVFPFYGSLQEIPEGTDVIVSTVKKSGTGRDIKGLKVLANTVSFAALNLAQQLPGRQRNIEGEDLYFLDFYNRSFESHQRHLQSRGAKYRDLAKVFNERNI